MILVNSRKTVLNFRSSGEASLWPIWAPDPASYLFLLTF